MSATPIGIQQFFALSFPPGRILNVGAGGTGWHSDGRIMVNVDDHLPPELGHGFFVIADAHHLPFATQAFSGALCKDVLEHVDDPRSVMNEVRRVTSPDALLVATVPRAVPRAVWADFTHKRGFTRQSLLELLRQTKWKATHAPRRIGSLPGATRLGLVPHLELVMRIPILGHYLGTNWIVRASRVP